MSSVWRNANGRRCDVFDPAGKAPNVTVAAQQTHDIVDTLDARRHASMVPSRWPSGNVRFSRSVTARNSIKRTPAHSAFHDFLVSARECNARKSTINVRGDGVRIDAIIDRPMRLANAQHMQSSRLRSLRKRMRALASWCPNDGGQDKRTGTRAVASVCLHMSWRGTQVRWQRAVQVRAPRSTLELARAVYAGMRWPLPALAECARPTKIDFALVSRLYPRVPFAGLIGRGRPILHSTAAACTDGRVSLTDERG